MVTSFIFIMIDKFGFQSFEKAIRNSIIVLTKLTTPDDEYLEIKTDCKDQIEKLKSKLTKVKDKKKIDFPKLLDHALSNVVDLAKVFISGDITIKRQIISSIFPEKLEFFENHYRTIRPNILLSYIYQINHGLCAKKKTGKIVNYHLFPVLYP